METMEHPPGLGPWLSGAVSPAPERFGDDAVHASLTDRFLTIAGRHAGREALASPAGRWTYAELERDVRRRAGGIIASIGAGARPVAVMVTHDGPLVVTVLAVIAAGHIVVVLDPTAPADQHAQALVECGAPLLLHDDAHADPAGALAASVEGVTAVALDDVDRAGAPLTDLPRRTADDPMMLAFTSGTSGAPKAGIITHGVLTNLVRGATDALGLGPDDRMPMLFPMSLAVAAYPMFLPLLNGGALATLDVRSVGLAPMADFLADERITVAYLAPTVVRFLVDALAGREFPELRLVALGGELVDAEVVGLARDLLGPELLANGYGTTETGVITLYLIDPDDPPSGAVPAGYPVPDVELYILDDHGEAVPAGTTGEIAVASPYLFAGYWGHPELNRQVLSDDPGRREGWRLYRTGDFGHVDEHGALVVSGRLDTRVKIRGRFVVLGDVEAALHELDGVAAAAVTAIEQGGVTELVAYVVADGSAPLDHSALRARMLDEHEAYRVPTRWLEIDELPRLPNGKTDRRALPSPEVVAGSSDGGRPAMAPSRGGHTAGTRWSSPDELRDRIRGIWERLLPVGSINADEDFFHLGGDSLLAAQMLVEVERDLGVTVPMGELVHARTIRGLAAVITRRVDDDHVAVDTVACVTRGDESERPRLWFVHDLQGSAYRVRHLAEALGPDQPVWSFESPLLRGEPNPFTSLDTFVARYLTDLMRAQPEGPYWLAGYSFGGVCAYEMARQLRRDGHEVAFVGVVDVGPGYRGPGWHARRSPLRPWFGVAPPPDPGSNLRERWDHYRAMVDASPAGALRHLSVRTGLSRWIDPPRFRRDLRRDGRVRPEWRLWYAWEEHWKLAATAWNRSRTYGGRVDLFWASDSPSADASMGWAPLVGELVVHRFAGDHLGVLEPRGASSLAEVLRSALDDTIAATPT